MSFLVRCTGFDESPGACVAQQEQVWARAEVRPRPRQVGGQEVDGRALHRGESQQVEQQRDHVVQVSPGSGLFNDLELYVFLIADCWRELSPPTGVPYPRGS